MPDKDPLIIGAPKLVKPGEQMLLNCTTDYSLPPSDINWYIDNELQKVCYYIDLTERETIINAKVSEWHTVVYGSLLLIHPKRTQ